MVSNSAKRVAALWAGKRATSLWQEGGVDPDGGGWDEGSVQYGLEAEEDMRDGSLVPPVRDSYGNKRTPPDVSGGVNLNELAKKLARSYGAI
jgi:hypothetical protein